MFPSAAGSVISKLQEEVTTDAAITEAGSINQASTDDQLFEKIESHLHEKIAAGDKTAPFLLGQFYYEEVGIKLKFLYFYFFLKLGFSLFHDSSLNCCHTLVRLKLTFLRITKLNVLLSDICFFNVLKAL